MPERVDNVSMSSQTGGRKRGAMRTAEIDIAEAKKAFFLMVGFIALIWVLQIFNWVGHYRLDYDYGILPRNIGRLPQIFSAPFLHFSWDHIEGREDPEAASRLTMALAPSRLTLAVDPAGGVRLVSADHDPFSRVIGAVAAAIAQAATTGTWARLKCCPGRSCGWAFYDRSASSRSRWCSMQICGARAKMRAYRDRLAE